MKSFPEIKTRLMHPVQGLGVGLSQDKMRGTPWTAHQSAEGPRAWFWAVGGSWGTHTEGPML